MSHLPNSFLVTQIYNYFHSKQTHKHQNSFIMKTFSEINITNTNPNKRSKKKKTPTPTSEAKKENTTPQRAKRRKKNITPQRAKRCCIKKAQRSGLTFLPWSEGAFRSVKNKKLFERSEFFLFSGEKCRSRQKSADGEFLCFVSLFVQRNEEPSRLEREQSVKALAAIEQKP